jgi:monovalent cation:H+ antiporter-2, CPA2 family
MSAVVYTHHARESGHPIVTSVEPREDWSYCYVDDAMFVVPDGPQ